VVADDGKRDPWAVPASWFGDMSESDREAHVGYLETRIQQIKDGTIPFRNVIRFDQLKEMAGEPQGTVRDQ
jgi:hypothetical protein